MAGKAMDKENRPDDVTQETEVIEEVTTGVESVDDAGNAIVAVDETITPVDGADTGSVGPSVGPATGDDAGGHVAPGSKQEAPSSSVADDLNKQHKDRSRNHRMKSKEDILGMLVLKFLNKVTEASDEVTKKLTDNKIFTFMANEVLQNLCFQPV